MDRPCIDCGEVSAEAFWPDRRRHTGRMVTCKECTKRRRRVWTHADPARERLRKKRDHLQYRYGISVETFDEMMDEQQELCAICFVRMANPHVDHDHKTGLVRQLLCGQCNHALGNLRDDPLIAVSAAEYLWTHRG